MRVTASCTEMTLAFLEGIADTWSGLHNGQSRSAACVVGSVRVVWRW
jgi:hypothetical protein